MNNVLEEERLNHLLSIFGFAPEIEDYIWPTLLTLRIYVQYFKNISEWLIAQELLL